MNEGISVAVMQPYLFPYLGYFRLLYAADYFVFLDCVQFPRRGRVHRCEITSKEGDLRWLTLPIQKCSRDTPINMIELHEDASQITISLLEKHPHIFYSAKYSSELFDLMFVNQTNLSNLLISQIIHISQAIGINTTFMRSSEILGKTTMKGENKLIEIVKLLGGNHYINLNGGKNLYAAESFNRVGITLKILAPYTGKHLFLLNSLSNDWCQGLLEDISSSTYYI